MLEIGLTSLRWLLAAQTTENGHFAPIGCHGFWIYGGDRARFDQQPLEAHAMVSACLEAYAITRDEFWRNAARRASMVLAYDLGNPYDPTTGVAGCAEQDGLTRIKALNRVSPLSFIRIAEANAQAPVLQSCAA